MSALRHKQTFPGLSLEACTLPPHFAIIRLSNSLVQEIRFLSLRSSTNFLFGKEFPCDFPRDFARRPPVQAKTRIDFVERQYGRVVDWLKVQ